MKKEHNLSEEYLQSLSLPMDLYQTYLLISPKTYNVSNLNHE